MKYEDLKQQYNNNTRKKPTHQESKLQIQCVKWFKTQYPQIANHLFAVPNGGYRNQREAAIMKTEGITPGVADLILLYPNTYQSVLCIEMKTEKGKQTPHQEQWQKDITTYPQYTYHICRTLEQFINIVNNYLRK